MGREHTADWLPEVESGHDIISTVSNYGFLFWFSLAARSSSHDEEVRVTVVSRRGEGYLTRYPHPS